MAHTPGPWEQHSEYPDRIVVNGSCVYEVKDMTTEDGTPCVLDVALMAAAPEMLAACHKLVDSDLAVEEDERKHQLKLARLLAADAIAKAEGRVP